MLTPQTREREYRAFHLFCGAGGGAKGFRKATWRVRHLTGRWRNLGGIDIDAGAAANFTRFAGVHCTVRDLMDREQYTDFHGHEPPPGWVEATPADIRAAASGERPHCVFMSAPCKSFSGLLSARRSESLRYQALGRLTLRGIWLMLEAWGDDPPEMVLFENVPLIATRGRHLLDQIVALLRHYGYAVAETKHDCGELGGLAQSRKRFLLVARHAEKVPALLYEPPRRPLRSVGEILGRMHLPGDPAAGPMHRVPRLSWKTWVRLAFVEAGSDWRSLNKLSVENGHLRDYLIVPDRDDAWHRNVLGVLPWGASAGTVTGNARPTTGAFSVADVRFDQSLHWNDGQAYGVRHWDGATGTVAGQQAPGQGAYAVADPRHHGPAKHNNCFRIIKWSRAACAVTAGGHPTSGGQCVADPRSSYQGRAFWKYRVTSWPGFAPTVIGGDDHGAYAVADPRPGFRRERGDHYLTAGHYGVVPWGSSTGAVSASAGHDNGRWSVADPRLPAATDKLVCRIQALDSTWHRPFTTLELAALQSLYDPDDFAGTPFELVGSTSDTTWREWIGNLVPPDAAEAMATEIGRTLMLAEMGETFQLSATPIWVRPLAIAIAVDAGRAAA